MLDKTFERLKTDSAQTNLVRKAGLTMYESHSGHREMSVLTRLILEKLYEPSFCRDKRNSP